jgi:acetylornithine deacetylase/succinyl-diaminopimelate desuccinylase-like protein
VRPPPGFDAAAFDRELAACAARAGDGVGAAPGSRPGRGAGRGGIGAAQREARAADGPPHSIVVERLVDHAPFATRDADAFRALLGPHARALAPLQFWTEAAVLAEAGIDAVVIGPGDIGQAHAADEHVSRDDLAWAVALFSHALAATRSDAAG